MSDGPSTPKRVRLDNDEILNLTQQELVDKLQEQNEYIRYLESKKSVTAGDDDDGHESEGKLRQQNVEGRRENTLVLRLANKEQELQDCLNQISEMKQAHTQNTAQLRSMMLDPALNIIFQRMSKEVDDCKDKLKETQNELNAWKFTPDSQTGKRLMAKCRMLLQENEELGKMIASGRTAKLEGEIALQKTLVQEMKKNQQELDEFVGELEEDVEGMQCMIYLLQTQLKETKEQLAKVTAENELLLNRKISSDHDPGGTERNVPRDIKPSPTKPVISQNSNKDMLTVSGNSSENGQVASIDEHDEATESTQDNELMEIDTPDPVQTHILTADSTSHLESASSPAKSCSPKHSNMDTSNLKDSSETSPQTSKKNTSAYTCDLHDRDDSIQDDSINKTNNTEACSPSSFKDKTDSSPEHIEQDIKDTSPRCSAQDNTSPRHSSQENSYSPQHMTNDTRSRHPDNSGVIDLSNSRQSPEDDGGRNSVRDWSPRISDKPCDDDWGPKNSAKEVDDCSPQNRTKDADDTTPRDPKSDPDIISVDDRTSRTDSKPEIVTDSTTAHTDAEKTIHVPNGVEPLTQSEGGVD